MSVICNTCGMPPNLCKCGNMVNNMTIKTKSVESISDLAKTVMKIAHAGQKRWDGTPYDTHPEKVVQILKNWGVRDQEILAAGYLHDVLEDNKNFSKPSLEEKFNKRIADLVEELTIRDRGKYFTQLKEMSSDAKLIKFADLLSNITDMSGFDENPEKSKRTMRKWVRGIRIIANAVQQRLEEELFDK